MPRRKTEPVKYTCPDIDKVISTIKEIIENMKSIDTEDDIINDYLSDWISELNSIGGNNYSMLEDLRSSNSALREWGIDMYNEAEKLEMELDEANNKISNLENI